MPVFDFAALAAPALRSQLNAALILHGWNADVYKTTTDDSSVYAEIMPEESGARRFLDTTKVLLQESVTGSSLTSFISLVDKLDDEQIIICLYGLEEGMQLEIEAPDLRGLTYEVLNSEELHAQSTFPYKYYVRVR